MASYVQVVPSSGDAQSRLVKIQKNHLGYLRLDEGKDKFKARRDLEGLIAEHLSSVPHKEKFTCPNFLDILRRSIDERPDFKVSKAAQAFDALEKYALNLLKEPWRREYWTIRLYSGFFKHNVECNLSNAKEIFFLMGYAEAGDMEVGLTESIDHDRVTDVSLNCLIAAVECQIMMQILEKVGGTYSWKEIARVRRHNVGNAEKGAEILRLGTHSNRLDKNKMSVEGKCRNSRRNNGYVKVEKLVDVPGLWTDGGQAMEADERYPISEYGSTWEKKSVTNGHLLDLAPIRHQSFDTDAKNALSLMKKHFQSCESPDTQTRDGCWGYVDQSLEQNGYNKDNGERGNILRSSIDPPPGFSNRKPIPNPNLSLFDVPLAPKLAAFEYVAERKAKVGAFYNSQDPSRFRCIPPYATSDMSSFDSMNPNFSCLSSAPSVLPGHVYRTDVPYSRGQSHFYHPSYEELLHSNTNSLNLSNNGRVSSGGGGGCPYDFEQLNEALKIINIDDVRSKRGVTKRDPYTRNKRDTTDRRSFYDNLQADEVDTKLASQREDVLSALDVLAHSQEKMVYPPPAPFASVSSEAIVTPTVVNNCRRSSDGHGDVRRGVSPLSCAKEEPERLDVPDRIPSSSRKSSQSSSYEGRRGERGTSSARESVERSLASSTSSSRPRHERSASMGSVKSTGSGNAGGSGLSSSDHVNSGKRWSCWACTYLNPSDRDICDVCSRSRSKGAESNPLSSGGRECQHCTLVNEKGAKKCKACERDLENSPTYV